MIRQSQTKNKKRILIANRGEIAVRIAKACRELGHTAIGLWTENEKNGRHLHFCDEWIELRGSTNAETYLNIEKIIQIAKIIISMGFIQVMVSCLKIIILLRD